MHRKEGNRMPKDELRGRVVAMFRTVLNFAHKVGWSNRKAYDILNGKQEMTAKDIEVICSALDITIPDEMRRLIFV